MPRTTIESLLNDAILSLLHSPENVQDIQSELEKKILDLINSSGNQKLGNQDQIWSTANADGDTPLRQLMIALNSNPDNKELINIAGIVAKKADPRAWSIPLSEGNAAGDTALLNLMVALISNSGNDALIDIVGVVAKKADPSAWSISLSEGKWAGDTALRLLIIALNNNPDSKELIDIVGIVAKNRDPSAWSIPLSEGNVTGDTPLRNLMVVLSKNSDNDALIDIVGIVAKKVDPSAWSISLSKGNVKGDTALHNLMLLLSKNSDNKELIDIVGIVAKKVDPSAWLMSLSGARRAGDTPLSNLMVVFSSITNERSKEKIAIIWLVLLSNIRKNNHNYKSFSLTQGSTFFTHRPFLLQTMLHHPDNKHLLENSEDADTLLGSQFATRSWKEIFNIRTNPMLAISAKLSKQGMGAVAQDVELTALTGHP